jgi:hypothetical protein
VISTTTCATTPPHSRRKQNLKATYIWQLATKWSRLVLFSFSFLMAFSCVSQQGEFKVQNTTNTFWGKSMSKLLAEKVEGEKTFFLSSFPIDFFYRVFGRFSA